MNTPIQIGKKQAKNRILMPPMVCFNWADGQGIETVSRAEHYGKRAANGVGTIIMEATSIMDKGQITPTGLGLYHDDQIHQFKKVAKEVHQHEALVLVQLVHAGDKAKDQGKKTPADLSLEELTEIKEAFVKASLRAKEAGLDGVEIHGAHGYLLNQFTSSASNHRTDHYGKDVDHRTAFPLEVVKAVREALGQDFIIAYRFGVNDPTGKEDQWYAKELEKAGVDLLDVSAGIGYEGLTSDQEDLHVINYMGKLIKEAVSIPVACVFDIRSPEKGQRLLDEGYGDLIAVGRGLLADPAWANKAIKGEEINRCYHCEGWCKYAKDGRKCPWYQ